MRIALFTDQDLDADPFPEDDWPCDPRPYLPEAEWEPFTLERSSAVLQVIEALDRGFDLVFNLCDGAWDEERPGLEVVTTLERLGVPFTGASSACFEPTREAMKRVCRAWGIDTPGYVITRGKEGLERAAETLRFPLIIKHPSSYASTGLTRDSRVETAAALFGQGHAMIQAYGRALVEEFVEGTECTVLVSESLDPSAPVTYTPIRYRFPEGETFKHYDLKWSDFEGLSAEPVQDAGLQERLRNASARFFMGLSVTGYGRCDLRIADDGLVFMLEVNPNCGLYYPLDAPGSADLILLNDPAGHRGFTQLVVDAALARHRRHARGWEARSTREGDYGLYATQSFRPGELIVRREESPHHLVTLTQVEERWGEPKRSWFSHNA